MWKSHASDALLDRELWCTELSIGTSDTSPYSVNTGSEGCAVACGLWSVSESVVAHHQLPITHNSDLCVTQKCFLQQYLAYLALLTFLPVLPFLIPSVHSMQCSVCSVSIAQICLNSRMAPPRPTGSIREADVRQSRLFGAVNGQTEFTHCYCSRWCRTECQTRQLQATRSHHPAIYYFWLNFEVKVHGEVCNCSHICLTWPHIYI